MQKYITKGYYPSQKDFSDKLSFGRMHFEHYLEFSAAPKSNIEVFELGTGPWPIIPIALYILGASKINTYDIAPLVRHDVLKRTLELFSLSSANGLLEKYLGKVDKKRVCKVKELLQKTDSESPSKLLSSINIHLHIGDARTTSLSDNSVDLIFSTVVLEHISAEVLEGLLAEFNRVAAVDAVMSHYIGLADQYASFDKSISPFNFLRFTDKQWRLFNNPIIPLNRLRIEDYRNIFRTNGLEIVKEDNVSGLLSDLEKTPLSPKFLHYKTEDLLVLYSWLVVRAIRSRRT